MGILFGGHLSRNNQVTLFDVDPERIRAINGDGVSIREQDGSEWTAYPQAAADSSDMPPVDLIIVFVKSLYSQAALAANRSLIGPNTYLMTLQNGSGHESVLKQFAADDKIIIGTTQHNSSFQGAACVRHGGSGMTSIGLLEGDLAALGPLAENFTGCGIKTTVSNQVRRMIWEKMFTNVSASVLTGILQMPLGFVADNAHGWAMAKMLLREAVAVANAEGMGFDEEDVINRIQKHLFSAHDGITSIYADLQDGRKTEVDTINGSVVQSSRRCGVPAPCHEFVVQLVHAMEDKRATTQCSTQEG